MGSIDRANSHRRPMKGDEIPPPSYRHGAPSAPWPWVDISDDVDKDQLSTEAPPVPKPCLHSPCNQCWKEYPQSLFPNWTPRQVEKSKIAEAVTKYPRELACVVHSIDIDSQGIFRNGPKIEPSKKETEEETWEDILRHNAPKGTLVRALFIENMSGPGLQMLGTKYNVEPFFFSSSLNWIPSRYQEEEKPGVSDHITICLAFIRAVKPEDVALAQRESAIPPFEVIDDDSIIANQMINTQAPLSLKSKNRTLILDLLSIHLIRKREGSTIISFHSNKGLQTTKAPFLHERVLFAGQSVYWQNIFRQSSDPTFVLLTFIWHALYAWDEAFEFLYAHICTLENQVIHTSEMKLTQELHVIRAHHLHYSSLLADFRRTVLFIQDTINPAMDCDSVSEQERVLSKVMLERECSTILREIERLEQGRMMQDHRLKNVMDLVFSSVNIIDSRRMQTMTETAVRDSAAMKQIAYLTMVFLPASFVAAVFGMNVQELAPGTKGTVPHYIEAALPFLLLTVWIIIAFQSRYIFPPHVTFWKRLGWPFLLLARLFGWDPYSNAEKSGTGWTFFFKKRLGRREDVPIEEV